MTSTPQVLLPPETPLTPETSLPPESQAPPTSFKTDYLSVATDAHRRGFWTTPVRPGAKKPRLNEYNTKPAKNLSTAMQHAFDYPHDDCGLVSRRGVKNFCWLDIDDKRVEKMIFGETGHRLPRTLTTSSRPVTAPWKKHLCFRQTRYSLSRWTTEMTGIRDFSIVEGKDAAGKDIVPNLFDVKGCGGGGFVVAPGCCRATQTAHGIVNEQYIITDDSPIIDVPDWLVDWVITRYKKFRREDAARVRAEVEAKRRLAASMIVAQTELAVATLDFDPTKQIISIDAKRGGLIPKEYRNGFLKSLGGELATRGIPADLTTQMLTTAAEVCEPFKDDDERNRSIARIVKGLRIGNVWISRKQRREAEKDDENTSNVTGDVTGDPKGLPSLLAYAAQGLPWHLGEIPSHTVNEHFRAVVRQAKIKYGSEDNWKKAVSRALQKFGAKSRRSRDTSSGRVFWVWTMRQPPPPAPKSQ